MISGKAKGQADEIMLSVLLTKNCQNGGGQKYDDCLLTSMPP